MKVDLNTPGADSLMIAFNGEIVGFVLEADDEAGYIVQSVPGPQIDFLITANDPGPINYVRKAGKVAFLGNSDTIDRETLIANLNKHRADCGLPPFEAKA